MEAITKGIEETLAMSDINVSAEELMNMNADDIKALLEGKELTKD
jgi:hypothetical protein